MVLENHFFSSLGLRWPQDGPKKEKQFILRLLMLLLLMMTYDNDDDNDNDVDNEFFVMLLCRIPHDLRGLLLLFFVVVEQEPEQPKILRPQNGPKFGPTRPQDGPKMDPRWPQDDPKMAPR